MTSSVFSPWSPTPGGASSISPSHGSLNSISSRGYFDACFEQRTTVSTPYLNTQTTSSSSSSFLHPPRLDVSDSSSPTMYRNFWGIADKLKNDCLNQWETNRRLIDSHTDIETNENYSNRIDGFSLHHAHTTDHKTVGSQTPNFTKHIFQLVENLDSLVSPLLAGPNIEPHPGNNSSLCHSKIPTVSPRPLLNPVQATGKFKLQPPFHPISRKSFKSPPASFSRKSQLRN